MDIAISVVIVMGATGILFGFVLAFVNKKFAVQVNPLIHLVDDILPKGQCGACGYPGCMSYAEAVVNDPNVPPTLCIPGKDAVANKVAELTGKLAAPQEAKVAIIRCNGVTGANAKKNYVYTGIRDCVAANLIMGGEKSCKYGCLGFGTCASVCPFGAIEDNLGGNPIIDKKKCTACGNCVNACPRKVISIEPIGYSVFVKCNSHDKGAVSKKNCDISCIGCGICAKNCEYGAIKIENNLATVDAEICKKECASPTCIAKCPTRAIKQSRYYKPKTIAK